MNKDLGFPPMPKAEAQTPPKGILSAIWERKNGILTTAGLGAVSAFVGVDHATRPDPAALPPAPVPIVKQADPKPPPSLPAPTQKPGPVVTAPKLEASPYETKIRAAGEVDPHSHPVFIKRLLYLYRGVLRDTLAGKSEKEIRKAFVIEEKKLDLVNGLPVLRPIIVAEWVARYPANAPADVIRESNVRFWKETISILERLP